MTDISELVKRMRGLAEYVDDCDEAADALKAQAKEIAQLKRDSLMFADSMVDLTNRVHEFRARNAELEAALNGWQKWWELPWRDRRPDIAERCYRAASAALNGENG